jgi:hypothetical protein
MNRQRISKQIGIDISQFNNLNKGDLTSRQNGYVGGFIGGNMTKRLVEMAEQQLTDDETGGKIK